MARKPRVFYPNAIYHVMLRGNDGQKIFLTNHDKMHFYSLLSEGTERFAYKIHAYCLMSNHIHLIIQVSDISLSEVMHNISFRYTQWINFTKNRKGHLFQGRYKAILIETDTYLLDVVRYIHLNPVKACMTLTPEMYKWSSYRAYLGMQKLSWLTTTHILGFFSSRKALALAKFKAFTTDKHDTKDENPSSEIEEIILFERSPQEHLARKPPSFPHIIAAVCHFFSINESQLQSKGKDRFLADIRGKIAWLAKETGACTLVGVANFFGRDASGLSRKIYRIECDPIALKQLNVLKFALNESIVRPDPI